LDENGKHIYQSVKAADIDGSSMAYFIFPDVALQFLIIPDNACSISGRIANLAA
jgi:hypothetical protein